jgi:mRNA interferase YafQ
MGLSRISCRNGDKEMSIKKIRETSRFRKDMRRALRRGEKPELMRPVLGSLIESKLLPICYRDHALTGAYSGMRECHIRPDWLLIYRVDGDDLVLVRTGTHSDLFRE